MSVAGLDIGSGGCKCTIFNDDANIISYAYKEYSLVKGKYGQLELNPQTVWKAVQEVCLKANSANSGDKVKALCIASFGESGVVLNKKGHVLYNSMMYTDPRGEEQCQKMSLKLDPNEIMSRSGIKPHPMYSAYKLMWLRDNEPSVYKDVNVFMQYGDYILYMLSGEKYIDWSLASRTMLFNVLTKEWDDALLDAADLDKAILPKIAQTGLPITNVIQSAAQLTGFEKGTILLLGGHDQIVAAIGGGAIKAGQAVNGMGSVDCITPVFDRPIINDIMGNNGYACVPYLKKDNYVTYAFNFSSGSLLRWYRDQFGQQAVIDAKKRNISPYRVLEENSQNRPTGLLVLPHFQGAATPYMDTNSIGAIVGLTMETDSSTLYRGLMEGISYEMKMNIDILSEAGIKFNRLTACGGSSRSQSFLQLRADIFNIPIDVLEIEEAGTLGAAVLAGVACNNYQSIQDGVKRLVKIKETFYPEEKNVLRYREYNEQYNKMYPNIKKIYSQEKF